ncbi:hypothetical protein BT93_L2733 [Corymbia citriodora subsp. variegata]|uniref:Uncharacterized protein n=1 Tax=Corymbia citriodora subsp. variegata TaxID=360336 RepID=A0A8T0CJ09_CORYI|nr:hypothetical protein BT93_L2733 [Corymbia citriodora subsp. variegata]
MNFIKKQNQTRGVVGRYGYRIYVISQRWSRVLRLRAQQLEKLISRGCFRRARFRPFEDQKYRANNFAQRDRHYRTRDQARVL